MVARQCGVCFCSGANGHKQQVVVYFASGALSADTARELEVLGCDGDALGVDGGQIGVLEQPNQIGLTRALQRHDGVRLELQVRLEVLRHLPHQALERKLAAEQLRPLLVAADLAQGDCARPAGRCGLFGWF